MIRRSLLTLAALAATAPAAAQAPAARRRRLFEAGELALPAGPRRHLLDAAPTTALNPNGYGSIGQSTVAKNPPLDCFYVYPTVSRDSGMNSDLVVDSAARRGAAQVQFARFAGVCRTFAPIYRQMTLGAVAAAAAGADMTRPALHRLCATSRAAWRNYLAQLQQGPPVRAHRPQPGLADAAAADHATRSRASRSRGR